jgi:arylsulfatase A-like enzyme
VLVSIDDLRADHLGVYGHVRKTSPAIDALGRRGTVFRDASATAPWTLPSHLSIMTSLHPSEHGINFEPDFDPDVAGLPVLGDHFVTLAERFKAHGYRTVAFTNGTYVRGHLGFGQGFDRYFETSHADAVPILKKELSHWLQRRGATPFFVFLHVFKVHLPFRPPLATLRELEAKPELGRFGVFDFYRVQSGKRDLTPKLREQLKLLYDAEIRYTDTLIKALIDELTTLGLIDETLIVITSDHGEEFGEHGSLGHGGTLYEEVLRIPLMIAGPGVAQDRFVDAPVSTLDIMPTLLDLAGIPLDPGYSGRSLLPWLDLRPPGPEDERNLPRTFIAEVIDDGDQLISFRRGDHKAIFNLDRGSAELYDLATDPGETSDRSETEPAIMETFRTLLDDYLERVADNQPAQEFVPIDERMREELRAFGYEAVDAVPSAELRTR